MKVQFAPRAIAPRRSRGDPRGMGGVKGGRKGKGEEGQKERERKGREKKRKRGKGASRWQTTNTISIYRG